jgi:hypothetical protein
VGVVEVAELGGRVVPALDVEDHVVAAGAAFEEEWEGSEEGREGDEERIGAGARHWSYCDIRTGAMEKQIPAG